ncbi:aminopeptidase N [Rarobacter faecitabidus]|uniref:Aminopeptidase N n=1 Tax=Rarobacter faecitabidus TaxID=13243 RepID=A0A542ZWJ5_RARFA|nr:aminopeptidase N [Rarobacter faecitabidus]TQL64744.1 membrane alanyl aminopeptidase [Rarobacter faecitabidus]
MPGENLTRSEAVQRAATVTTHSYDVTLDLTQGPETFESTTVIRFDATPGGSAFLDLVAPRLREIELNGVALDVNAIFEDSRIALSDLKAHNTVRVVANAAYTNTGEGLHRFVDPVDGEAYLYSQFEVPDARRMYATFEQPDLKATFAFTVRAPEAWKVVSNSPAPAPVKHGDGTATWSFAPTPRISTYITALVAGPYHEVRGELTSSDGRTIPLGVYCRTSLAEFLDADYILETTRRGFAFFEAKFDVPYPFEKYDQLFVPEYNMGAMENAGCVTFTETYVFRSNVTDAIRERRVVTILHELAHMWFGDLVTMKWWNDLWLNESFAEWASTLATAEATEWHDAWTTFASMEKAWAYRQDQLPSTHPIVAPINDLDDVQVNFDGITYAKGGSVLKQLAAWVGLDEFLAGVSAYFKKHAFGNTELKDLLVELEASSGRDLSTWSRLWLETAGVNTLRPLIEIDGDGIITSFEIEQTAIAEQPTLRPHRLAVGFYSLVPGEDGHESMARVHRVELDIDGPGRAVPQLVGLERPQLVLLNDDDLAYAKIRLDADSWEAAIAHLSKVEDTLARALIWGSAWDSTRDGEFPASRFIDLILDNVAVEDQSTTLRTVLGQLLITARTFVAPQKRAATLEKVADRLWELASAAPAGSDQQLQFVKTFAAVASTNTHAQVLANLKSGELVLEGLAIDTDLTWELLDGLVLTGAAGEAEIAAQLAADDTANGRQFAARARATVPDREVKLATLKAIIADRDAPNAIIRHTAAGLGHATDPALLDVLVEPYYDAITQIWRDRSFHIADELIEGLFPAALATRELADSGTAWLNAHPDVPAALRRYVREQVSSTERALTAQRVDAAN